MTDRAIRDQVRRAVAVFNAGRHDDARRICEDGLRQAPNEAALNHLLAVILFAKGDFHAARTRVEASLAAKPDNPPARLLAGRIARSEQDYLASLGHLDRAVAMSASAEALVERARTLDAAGMRDAARDAWRAVLRVNPSSREAAARLGWLLSKDGKLVEAATMLELAVSGDAPASMWFELGLVRQDLHDLAGAAVAYRRALEKRPGHAETAVNLGIVLQDLGDMDGAMQAYRKAYSLNDATFGMIATSLTSAPHGRLWLDPDALKRVLRG
jgi:tetratricopeptide (TPR) repeat protein